MRSIISRFGNISSVPVIYIGGRRRLSGMTSERWALGNMYHVPAFQHRSGECLSDQAQAAIYHVATLCIAPPRRIALRERTEMGSGTAVPNGGTAYLFPCPVGGDEHAASVRAVPDSPCRASALSVFFRIDPDVSRLTPSSRASRCSPSSGGGLVRDRPVCRPRTY
jgi:hypothetical protein